MRTQNIESYCSVAASPTLGLIAGEATAMCSPL